MATPRSLPPPLTEKERAFVVHTYLSHGRSLTAVRTLWSEVYGTDRPVPSRTTFWRAIHKFETQASLADGRKTNRRPKMNDGKVEAMVLKMFIAQPNMSIRDATRVVSQKLQRSVSRGTVHKIVTEHRIAGRTNRVSYRANAAAVPDESALDSVINSDPTSMRKPEVPKRRRMAKSMEDCDGEFPFFPEIGRDEDCQTHEEPDPNNLNSSPKLQQANGPQNATTVGMLPSPHQASTSATYCSPTTNGATASFTMNSEINDHCPPALHSESSDKLLSDFVRRCVPPLDNGDVEVARQRGAKVALFGAADAAMAPSLYLAARAAVLAGAKLRRTMAPFYYFCYLCTGTGPEKTLPWGLTRGFTGAERVDVFCGQTAASDIRVAAMQSAVNIRVHTWLPDSTSMDVNSLNTNILWQKCGEILTVTDAVIFCPGLPLDNSACGAQSNAAKRLVQVVKSRRLPMIFLGESLDLIVTDPINTVTNCPECILIPLSIGQAHMLLKNFSQRGLTSQLSCDIDNLDLKSACQNLASVLGGVTVVLQGETDVIGDGRHSVACSEAGGLRYCWGQAELLAGALAVFSAWTRRVPGDNGFSGHLLSAYAACLVTRRCAELAFMQRARSATSGDLLLHMHTAVDELLSEDR